MARRRFFGGQLDPATTPPSNPTAARLWGWVLWSQRWYIAFATVIGILWMATIALIPVILGRIIDDGIRNDSTSQFWWWIGILAADGVISAALWTARHQMTIGNGARIRSWFSEVIAERLLDDESSLERSHSPGELITLIASDSRRMARYIESSARAAGYAVTFIAVITTMFFLSPMLTGILLALLVPPLVAMAFVVRQIEKHSRRQQQSLARAASIASDTITGLRVIRGIGGTREVLTRYDASSNAALQASSKAVTTQAASTALAVAMPGLVMALIGWLGGRLVINGTMTPGELLTFFGWSVFLIGPLLAIEEMSRRFAIANAGAWRLAKVLATPRHLRPPMEQLAIDLDVAPDVAIDLRSVVAHRRETQVLDRLDLSIGAQRFTAIVGDDEAVTTLADAIGRTIDIDAGSITLFGVDIASMPLEQLRTQLIVAEHDAMLFRGSLRRNLLVGSPTADDQQMLHALDVAGATDIVEGLTDGLDGIVSERGRSLSGGQRQRVALARAVLTDPPVLVLVDPTSALDAFTESDIVRKLYEQRRGKTTVVVTSSPAMLHRADEVIFVSSSAVLGRGSHDDLLEAFPLYRNRFFDADDCDAVAERTDLGLSGKAMS